jgi:alginate O-acetyltransferase complex protein AlgI
MLFASSTYMAAFLPIVLLSCILFRRVAGPRAAQLLILIASLVFYSWFKLSNLPYLLCSLLINCFLARILDRAEQPRRKRLMQLGLVLNIGYLCTFKYINFFLDSISFLLPHHFHLPELEFPLGVSFFTLSQIMYLVDTYEGLLPAMNLFDYATFVSFFPYIISGPIPRAKRIQHQLGDFGGKSGEVLPLLSRGIYLFTLGLFKKVFFADVFAKLAVVGFHTNAHLSAVEAWGFSLSYAFQMYFDFSGYSDMAIGSALMFGIEIPRNFDAPLRAKSIAEFWQRWHISLSQFITTYLYTPMLKAMRKRKLFKSALFTSAVAVFAAMTIAGLWHGPAWTYVVYGLIHGSALACNQFWHKKNMPRIPAFPSWALTFLTFLVALIFFGATDLHSGGHMVAALVNPRHPLLAPTLITTVRGLTTMNLLLLPIGVLCAFVGKSSDELSRDFQPTLANSFATAGLFVSCCLFMVFNTSQNFLYFQF